MIIPVQVNLQAIQQVPFEAIVERRWGAWWLLKQCCHDFLLIWRQFPPANVKHTMTHKSFRNRIWKAGILYFYDVFSICLSLYMTTTLLQAQQAVQLKNTMSDFFFKQHNVSQTVRLNTAEWQFMKTLNNCWGCTSYCVQSGQSAQSFNVPVTSNHQDHDWISYQGAV